MGEEAGLGRVDVRRLLSECDDREFQIPSGVPKITDYPRIIGNFYFAKKLR